MSAGRVSISTAMFEWTHGRKPRGRGYWCFETLDGRQFWFNGLFSEAKSRARKAFADMGIDRVSVGT